MAKDQVKPTIGTGKFTKRRPDHPKAGTHNKYQRRQTPEEKFMSKLGVLPYAVWLAKAGKVLGHKNASMPTRGEK